MNEVSWRDEPHGTGERNLVGDLGRASWMQVAPRRGRGCVPSVSEIGWPLAGVYSLLVMEALGPVCIFCGGVVEKDERLIVIEHDGERETSFAREPGLLDRARTLVAHTRCAPARPSWQS